MVATAGNVVSKITAKALRYGRLCYSFVPLTGEALQKNICKGLCLSPADDECEVFL